MLSVMSQVREAWGLLGKAGHGALITLLSVLVGQQTLAPAAPPAWVGRWAPFVLVFEGEESSAPAREGSTAFLPDEN